MSYWTYVSGVVEVHPMGRTQHEMRYVLETILDHLPNVTGSERDMHVHVVQCAGHNCCCLHDEFDVWAAYSNHADYRGWIHQQSHYLLVLEGNLRDRMFDETLREFTKWLTRLAKRCWIDDVLVKVFGQDQMFIFNNEPDWYDMFESDLAWADYLMWERDDETGYPKKLVEKYENKVKE